MIIKGGLTGLVLMVASEYRATHTRLAALPLGFAERSVDFF